MNYELAKELFDAGYPSLQQYNHQILDDQELLPTLSELIEACGDGFFWLVRKDKETWVAQSANELAGGPIYTSPEEAVARLWLALNKS